jgi:TatD DNase family protein
VIDTHVHLSDIEQVEQALAQAQAAGIERIVAVGMEIESNARTLDLARRFSKMVFPAVGYHPWEIDSRKIETELAFIAKHLPTCVALGEVGLDYKVKIPKHVQWDVFGRVLDMASKYDKPVIVHSRFSHQRSHRMVAAAGINRAVFHWYSGPQDVLTRILDDGYYVSATPALAYSPAHQAAMVEAPLERVLIETDAPVAYQGRIAAPATLVETLDLLSRLKRLPGPEVARITTANAERFFNL